MNESPQFFFSLFVDFLVRQYREFGCFIFFPLTQAVHKECSFSEPVLDFDIYLPKVDSIDVQIFK